MKAQKTVNTKTNESIVTVSGNTYPHRTQLGKRGLGFSWYGAKKVWYMPESRFTDKVLQGLIKLGVDVSGVQSSNAPQTPSEAPGEPQIQTPSSDTVAPESPSQSNMTDKSSGEYGGKYESTSYPINENIYSQAIDFDIEGQRYPLMIQFGRSDRIGYGDRKKTMPYLTYKVFFASDPENILIQNSFRPKDATGKAGRWNKIRGPNYNEDEIVQKYVEAINKNTTRIYMKVKSAIIDQESLGQRDPGLADFLQKIEDWRFDSDKKEEFGRLISENIPMRQVQLDTPGYEGTYPIGFDFVGNSIYPRMAFKHPLAPNFGKSFNFASIPVTPRISTIQQLNDMIDQSLQENEDRIKKDYLEYLQSFAFSEQEQEETRATMKPIADMIKNKTIELGLIKTELMRRQFIRPRKSRKRMVPGMVPEGGFKLIIDDKAIRNATFERGNSPEYFWAAIAYNLMRVKHNNIGFMPIFLDDAYRKVAEIVKRYGHDITAREVASYIDNASRALYNDLTGKTYQSWDEKWNEFYSGGYTGGEAEPVGVSGGTSPQWQGLCQEEGLTGAPENVKKEFRALSIKYHPDTCQGDPAECFKRFDQLKQLYDRLPENLRRASNWYQKIKFSSL